MATWDLLECCAYGVWGTVLTRAMNARGMLRIIGKLNGREGRIGMCDSF